MLCDKVWGFVKRYLTVPGVVIIFAAAWVLMLAVDAGATGAAWIQAFGSIGAIIAATYIARSDRKVQQDRDKERIQVMYVALSVKLLEAKLLVERINKELERGDQFQAVTKARLYQSLQEQVDQKIEELGTFSLSELPSPEIVNALVAAISTMRSVKNVFENLLLLMRSSRLEHPEPLALQQTMINSHLNLVQRAAEKHRLS